MSSHIRWQQRVDDAPHLTCPDVIAARRRGRVAPASNCTPSDQAQLKVTFANGLDRFAGPVGLDGVFRTSPGKWDLPVGMRGAWTDPQTFFLDRDEIANNGALLVTMHFEGDHVTVKVRERTIEATVSVTGTRSAAGD